MHRFLPLLVLFFVLLSFLLFKDDIFVFVKKTQLSASPAYGELNSQKYRERILLSDGKTDPLANKGVWFDKKVSAPGENELARIFTPLSVLGANDSEKWIEVNLSEQKLYAHEGNSTIYTFPVSSGLPWLPTVTGEFRIWAKLTSQRMTGGSKTDGTFYDLPNVPYVQYFYNGYGLHGTYWHHDFGKPRSHGCINLSIEDAKTLFFWTNPQIPSGEWALFNIPPETSTRVIVHGTTPTNIY